MFVETRGRKRLPLDQHKPPQSTVKINDAILPLVKLLKANLKKGLLSDVIISDLTAIANNKRLPFKQTTVLDDAALSEQAKALEALKAENLRLTAENKLLNKPVIKEVVVIDKWLLKYDAEHNLVLHLKSELARAKLEPAELKGEIERLNGLERSCQALKVNGDRCTRIAKDAIKHHGIAIKVCPQHRKLLGDGFIKK